MPEAAPLSTILERLGARKADALTTLEMLRAQRARVVDESAKFESPQAILEYLDFFIPAFVEVVREIERIAAAIPGKVLRSHVDVLRDIASYCRISDHFCIQVIEADTTKLTWLEVICQ